MAVIVFLAICIAAAAAAPSNAEKIGNAGIIGGRPENAFAALLYSPGLGTYRYACGGTIVSNKAILTAAHCVIGDDASKWRFRVGSKLAHSGGFIYDVSEVIVHPAYNPVSFDSDVGLLLSASNIVMGSSVRPVTVAGPDHQIAPHLPGFALDWTQPIGPPSDLWYQREIVFRMVNQEQCKKNYSDVSVVISENMFCARPYWQHGDQCSKDSGGPIFENGLVIGVQSFGVGCNLENFPNVFVRASKFSLWISENA